MRYVHFAPEAFEAVRKAQEISGEQMGDSATGQTETRADRRRQPTEKNTRGGTRTHTEVTLLRILSPGG